MSALRGLTWNHDRGLAPLLATAREFERREGVAIQWEARSLHEFGDVSVASIADQYDMIVIDHPFMGDVARDWFLLPLDEFIDAKTLSTLGEQSVGASHQSYFLAEHQWALGIDAASQVAGYRADLLRDSGFEVPRTWDEVLALAKTRRGLVTPALLPLDSMMCFFSLCANFGKPAFEGNPDVMVDASVGEEALDVLRELSEHALSEAFTMNPIAIWERMSSADDIGYCPLAFGYSNYARPGYRRSIVQFTGIPSRQGQPVGATLGGAGLALTAKCRDTRSAVEYAKWIASADCQRGLYVEAGGQPGNRVAWTDPAANGLASNYFRKILPTVESAYVRPRFAGFVDLQTAGGKIVWNFLHGDGSGRTTIHALNELYRSWNR